MTAAIFDGTHIGVGHVGDSRGYLLREGTLSQLTNDHTFVQSLIDEGRITEDEARVHPHRNLILRAVDGVHEPEPDVFTLEVALGDRILLCSDGCSGVLPDAELARILAEGTPDHAAVSLVSAALDAGSSDNVTVVVADLVEDDAVDDPETTAASLTGPMLVGAAAERPRRRGLGSARAARGADTGELEPVADESGRRASRSIPRRCATPPGRRAGTPGRAASRSSPSCWCCSPSSRSPATSGPRTSSTSPTAATHVVIYRGVEADVPGIRMHHVEETSTLTLDDLPTYNQRQVRDGISASSLEDARGVVSRLERLALCPEPTPTPSATPSPSATTSPQPGQQHRATPGTKSTASALTQRVP